MVGKQRTLCTRGGTLHRQGVSETTANQIFKCKVDRDWNKSVAKSAITFAACLGTKSIVWLCFILIRIFFKFLQELEGKNIAKCSRLNIPINLYSVLVYTICNAALITTVSQCLPVMQEATWLTSVKCLCSLLLSSGEDVCSAECFLLEFIFNKI